MTNVIFSARLSRRSLLASTAVCLFVSSVSAGALPIGQGMPWSPGTTRPPAPVRPGPWIFFSADEASLVEAAVDRPVPADERGPGGKDAGCAIFIDRQLAGPYGRGDGLYMKPPFMSGAATQGYQMPDTPAAQYRGGLKALGEHVKNAFDGKSFSQLPTRDQDEVLAGIEAGSIALKDVNGAQFFALLLANAMEGSFADPIYGGNRDMAGWNLIGF
jgi:gluconate 2-dehydrogenase gamma chain